MKRITRKDILDIVEYEKVRSEFKKKVIAMKSKRRLSIGDKMTLLFENRETVRFQIQEMMRVERIVHEDAIKHEIDTYNQLIPGDNELSATLFIEVTEYNQIRETLDKFVGLPQDCVYLDLKGNKIYALFDLEQSSDARVSAVQYIRFPLTEEQVGDFKNNALPAVVCVEHKYYQYTAPISGELREILIKDFEE